MALLGDAGGRRWWARHVPDAYIPLGYLGLQVDFDFQKSNYWTETDSRKAYRGLHSRVVVWGLVMYAAWMLTSDQIREIRTSLGLTQVQLAQIIGAHHITISRWERPTDLLAPTPYRAAMLRRFAEVAEGRELEAGARAKAALVERGAVAALAALLVAPA